jgi:cytochrome bd-type quinol oxidase subunit 2
VSAPEKELREIVREEVQRSWSGIALFILGSLSALYIFVLFVVVPKFQQIYNDALPGMPLPSMTKFVVYGRLWIALAVLAWLIAGAILRARQNRSSYLWANLGIFVLVAGIGLTIYVLIMPMISMPGGMSDAGK